MAAVHPALAPMCVAAILIASGCGRESAPSPAPTETSPTAAATTSPDHPDGDRAPEPDAEAAGETGAPEPDAELSEHGEDWLVWFRRGDAYRTRWVHVIDDRFEIAGERGAVIVSDGARLWRLVRRDAVDSVTSCGCVTDDDGACAVLGRLTRPGLSALDLENGRETPIVTASTAGSAGDGLEVSLSLTGGAGALLFFETSESGYECGAHNVYDRSAGVFDLARGARDDELYDVVGARLPASVRDPAVSDLVTELARCDGEALEAAEVSRQMKLAGVHLALDEAGKPAVSWGFVMPLPYICAPDYRAYGGGDSGLLSEASELSLGGPVPAGLSAALADVGAAPTVGLSRVTATGGERAAALARFLEAPEAAWPPESFAVVPIDDPAEARDALAMREVRAGRKLVRERDYTAALMAFDRAVELAPKLALARSGRGHARLLAGDLTGARADLDEALKLGEGPVFAAQIHFNLGQVAERAEDLATAREEYARSLELRPNPAVEAALKRVSE